MAYRDLESLLTLFLARIIDPYSTRPFSVTAGTFPPDAKTD